VAPVNSPPVPVVKVAADALTVAAWVPVTLAFKLALKGQLMDTCACNCVTQHKESNKIPVNKAMPLREVKILFIRIVFKINKQCWLK
jgi:hypothetical protein